MQTNYVVNYFKYKQPTVLKVYKQKVLKNGQQSYHLCQYRYFFDKNVKQILTLFVLVIITRIMDSQHGQDSTNLRILLDSDSVKTAIWVEQALSPTLRATVTNSESLEEYELFFSESQFAAREDLRNFFSDIADLFEYLSSNPQSIVSEGRGEIRFTVQIGGAVRKEKQFLLTLMRKKENQIEILEQRQHLMRQQLLKTIKQKDEAIAIINKENQTMKTLIITLRENFSKLQKHYQHRLEQFSTKLAKLTKDNEETINKLSTQNQALMHQIRSFENQLKESSKQYNSIEVQSKKLAQKIYQLERYTFLDYHNDQTNAYEILPLPCFTTIKRVTDQAYQAYIHRFQIKQFAQCTAFFNIINVPNKLVVSPYNHYFHVGVCDRSNFGRHMYIGHNIMTYTSNGLIYERSTSRDIAEKYTDNDRIGVKVDLRENANTVEWIKNDKKVGKSQIPTTMMKRSLFFIVITYYQEAIVELEIRET